MRSAWWRRLASPAGGGLLGLAIGLACGVLAHRQGGAEWEALVAICRIVGGVWIAALALFVLPLTFFQVAAAAASYEQLSGRRGAVLLAVWAGQLVLGLAVAYTLAPAVLRWLPPPRADLGFAAPAAAPTGAPASADPFAGLVGVRLLQRFCERILLPLLLSGAVAGLALRWARPPLRRAAADVLVRGSRAIIRIVGVLLRFLPAGAFALAYLATARAGAAWVGALGYYASLCSALLLFVTLLLYPLTRILGRIPMRRFAVGAWPSQLVATTSRSSIATVSVMIEGAEDRLGLSPEVAGVVVPLSAATFKINRGISTPTKMLVMAAVFGVHPTAGQLLSFTLIVAGLSLTSPGIPAGGSLITLPAYLATGLPLAGILLFEPADPLPDPFKTLANVTATLSATAIVERAGPPAIVRDGAGGAQPAGSSQGS